ncbi:MAG: MBL fold metallo-hydrolase [Haloarculaceae archaeon]
MKRIQLENRFFEGQNNAYLFADAEPVTLVDTGAAEADTREQLVDAMAAAGVSVSDLDRILLTHFHADHAGLVSTLQEDSDASVFVHEGDAPMVEGGAEALAAVDDRREQLFAAWGMPEEKRDELRRLFGASEEIVGDPTAVEQFTDGDELAAGGETLTAVHLPGHTVGLSGFLRETPEGEELFTGDALLPEYTPNVGGADVRTERPLEQYLDTLATIVERDPVVGWPGHRDPIDDPAARASEIIHHHHERTERVLGVLADRESADAWTVSAELFGDLSGIHVLHGPGEAYAHLEHLRAHDRLTETDGQYALVEDDPEVASLFPDVD